MIKKRWIYALLAVSALILCMLVKKWKRERGTWYTWSKEEQQYAIDLQNALIAGSKELDFYGKFIDQHGDPVEGVEVYIELDQNNDRVIAELAAGKSWNDIIDEKQTKIVRYTDLPFKHLGLRFHIHPLSVHKDPGYIVPIYRLEDGFGYDSSVNNHHTDPAKPFLFRMWKRLSYEGPRGLIEQNKEHELKADGKWHGHYLITGENLSIKDPRADLILSARIEPHGEDTKVVDLILTLKMLKGGIQKGKDRYRFSAPEGLPEKDRPEGAIKKQRRYP